jgi:Cu/Ag efflux protein CusF
MRRTIGALGLLATVIMALALAGPQVTAAYTAKRGMRHVTGTVVAVDEQAKTLRVEHAGKRGSIRDTFVVEPDAVAMLGQLKPGDRVTVRYAREHGKLTAEAITPAGREAGK